MSSELLEGKHLIISVCQGCCRICHLQPLLGRAEPWDTTESFPPHSLRPHPVTSNDKYHFPAVTPGSWVPSRRKSMQRRFPGIPGRAGGSRGSRLQRAGPQCGCCYVLCGAQGNGDQMDGVDGKAHCSPAVLTPALA